MSKFKLTDYPSLEPFLGDNYLGDGNNAKKRDLLKICNELGFTVYTTKFNNDSLSGIIQKDENSWAIYVNATDPPKRKYFTIAHELGHYFSFTDEKLSKNILNSAGIHEDKAIFGRPNDHGQQFGPEVVKMEAEANFIAANLLMPANLVEASFLENKNIEEMAEEFGVSESAMGFRLLNLGLKPIESVGIAEVA